MASAKIIFASCCLGLVIFSAEGRINILTFQFHDFFSKVTFLSALCPNGYTALGNYCYKYHNEYVTRSEARMTCLLDNTLGNLWAIESQQEFYAVMDNVVYPGLGLNPEGVDFRSGSGPIFWTDGLHYVYDNGDEDNIWSSTFAPIEFDYEMVCVLGSGQCLTVGHTATDKLFQLE